MILFDLDGTLLESNGIWVEVDLTFLKQHKLTYSEEYAYTVGHSIFPLAAQFTKDYYHLDLTPGEIMDEWMLGAREAYAQAPLKPGAAEFLAQCAEGGETMALVTACVPELCKIALARHDLEKYFTSQIFAEELGIEKRNPRIYALAAERLGVDLKDCTFYEDAPANCVAAKAAGIASVVGVYDLYYQKHEEEMRQTCDRYIRSFTELL